MEIGTDEIDDFENDEVLNNEEITTTQDIEDDSPMEYNQPSEQSEDDIISELLRERGILDSSKIKFENDNGEIEDLDWKSLSKEEKLNILKGQEDNSNSELDDSEIQLINLIRTNKMTPQEYINHVQRVGVQQYLYNYQPKPSYTIDQLGDDELFAADLIARVGEDNITDEEIQSMLETAKANETTFKKQVDAIRNEYRQIEDSNRVQEAQMQQQASIENFNAFAESVENEIRSFTDVSGYSLDMDESEMEDLYDFITGFDGAGTSILGKALNDPKTLVQMAWFALNGEQAIQDISNYWSNEVRNVRQNSYKQGVEDALNGKIKGKKSDVVIRSSQKNNKSTSFDDLDEF